MNATEEITKKRLEFLGLEVEDIESDGKSQSADFLAMDSSGTVYIIEVKSRTTDEQFNQKLIEEGEAYREDIDGRTNVASRKVKKAEKQLLSTHPTPYEDKGQTFRIVVFMSLQENDLLDTEQFRSTLYGIVTIIIPNEKREPETKKCIYFTYSDFYRFPTIDGVILMGRKWIELCPNIFGSQLSEFKNSFLYKKFSELNAVFLPIDAEKDGAAFIVDHEVDRSNEEVILKHLREKYNLEVDPIKVEPKLMEQVVRLDSLKFMGK